LTVKGNGPLQGFAVAAADRKFFWATAEISGDDVIISSPQVPRPVAVRYAWGDSPLCNLLIKAAFPHRRFAAMNGLP